MATVGKIDKLVRSFLQGSSDPRVAFDKFADLQDPTFLSFKIDFFPDNGNSFPDDAYSSGGLFRVPPDAGTGDNRKSAAYDFYDSAADYLRRIGSPTRQFYLNAFISILRRIQNEAPWYFQSVSGLGDLYKIDPAINFRGKDKVLTIECLESIDLRVTMMADLYRNMAFDMQNMREILPVNLRTFNMAVHVLEMRKFNTTYGIIADNLSTPPRPIPGQEKQEEIVKASKRKNVYGGNTKLFAGTFDNLTSIVNNVNSSLGGLFTNLGQQAGDFDTASISSAFEAISVQTFYLKDCEFDFYSESPAYLDTVSVKDSPEASFKFKIKVGKIQKIATYPFYEYVIAEYAKNTSVSYPAYNLAQVFNNQELADPYIEETNLHTLDNPVTYFKDYREAIYPTEGNNPNTALSDAVHNKREDSDYLKRKPLERLLGGLLRNVTGSLNDSINQGLGKLTGGLLGTAPLGNVYGDAGFLRRATESLNDFFTPGNQISTGTGVRVVAKDILRNINFDSLTTERNFNSPTNVYAQDPGLPAGGDVGTVNVFSGEPPLPTQPNVNENVFSGNVPVPADRLNKNNVLSQDRLRGVDNIDGIRNILSQDPLQPVDKLSKENVYNGGPGIPTDNLGKRNVFE